MGQKFMDKKGFTLIELLVAILIILILAGYSIFAYMESVEDASNAKAKATLELINSAMERFKIEYPNQNLTGTFTNEHNITTCSKMDKNPSRLIGCNYLQKTDFDNADYNFVIGNTCGDGYVYMTPKAGKVEGKYAAPDCAGINMKRGGKATDGTM
ncbi:MAG: prepilin-type N-terminal cleavage/methylation domain-containing protein [Elusimicrobiota bacterium]|jgi:prepilin-type N-terminal cleavage/methylation domain-containing protein|nr:prepilin-type N-terminal cleavage/methylation domain-containing protein [Elusimicrobiota bacterium]